MKTLIGLMALIFFSTLQSASAGKNFCLTTKVETQKEDNCNALCKNYGGWAQIACATGNGGSIPDTFIQSCLNTGYCACACANN
ncbi:MAG: hypothetical protein HYX35_05145 [Proteobacteria bacterium]|nr:hypothetical protein [Pseudomonadota bacterium]